MSVIFIALLVADVCWHIWEYKERKHLDKCWNDVFSSKIKSDMRWSEICCGHIDTILDLRTKLEKYKKETTNDK